MVISFSNNLALYLFLRKKITWGKLNVKILLVLDENKTLNRKDRMRLAILERH